MILQVVQGLAIGALAAISIIYTFQTRVPYPAWVLQAYDKPWVFLVLFLTAAIVFYEHRSIGAMLLLLLGAVWMDGLLFARSYDHHEPITTTPENVQQKQTEVWPYTTTVNDRIADLDTFGPSLETVPLPEPVYPVFYGLNDIAPGPAPF